MYRKSCFYIDSGYRYGSGFPSETAKSMFHNEAAEIFAGIGWRIQKGDRSLGCCDTAVKGKQELYLHPMELSGVILSEEIPVIENAISGAKSFRLRETRFFDCYEDMSDEAYATYLDEHRSEMVQAILSAYKTKRRNLFIPGDISEQVGKPFRILRVGVGNTADDMAYERVRQLTEELIAEGLLVTAQTTRGRGIRTAVQTGSKNASRHSHGREGR